VVRLSTQNEVASSTSPNPGPTCKGVMWLRKGVTLMSMWCLKSRDSFAVGPLEVKPGHVAEVEPGHVAEVEPGHVAEFKERALAEEMKNPHLLTVATLTGHADLACGPYTSVMDNGPARKKRFAFTCYEEGQGWGDAFEINTIRREDFEFHKGKSEYEDVLQCNNAPSTSTQRGHQGPAAFLMMASGLDKHEINSEKPIKYSHLDIAASSGPYPGVPTGSPVVGLAGAYFGHQITH